MTDTPEFAAGGSSAGPQGGTLSGKMYLYERPELLTPEEHGKLGLTPSDRPFEFTATVRAVPLTMTEFGSAQRHFPIVFASMENPVPLAVLAVIDDVNLFVKDGQWDPMCYVPSYLRCYPFAFAAAQDGKVAVVVDRAATQVTENPRFPFFADDNKITPETETLMRFCAQYESERKRTVEFCRRVTELGLLTAQRATHRPESSGEDQTLANYISIDSEKLGELEAGTVHELHKAGYLSAMYLQLYSLENWRHLMARRMARQQSDQGVSARSA